MARSGLLARRHLVLLAGALAAVACGMGGQVQSSRVEGWVAESARTLSRGSLVVANRDMTDAELASLLAHDAVPGLVELTLSRNALGPDSARLLTKSPKLRGAEVLQLSHNHLGDVGLTELARGKPSLRGLYVAANGGGPATARAFADAGFRADLLELSYQPLGDSSAGDLVRLGVDHLRLAQIGLGPAGAATLLRDAQGSSLVLDENTIGGLPPIASVSPRLAVVSLRGCELSAADAAVLAAAPAAGLKALILADNDLGDAGLRALAGASWLDDLTALDVTGSGAGADARRTLRLAWGARAGLTIGSDRPGE